MPELILQKIYHSVVYFKGTFLGSILQILGFLNLINPTVATFHRMYFLSLISQI